MRKMRKKVTRRVSVEKDGNSADGKLVYVQGCGFNL